MTAMPTQNQQTGWGSLDWTLGGLSDRVGGLLTDPQQQMALIQNPMFNVGMGLLSSYYDPNVNPFQAAVKGIAGAQATADEQEDRARIEELRRELAALIAAQGIPGGQMPPPQASPTSQFQQPPNVVPQMMRNYGLLR